MARTRSALERSGGGEDRERAAALIALSLFARSFILFARLLWQSFYFGLHWGFVAVALLQRQSAINVIKVICCRSAADVAVAAAAAALVSLAVY